MLTKNNDNKIWLVLTVSLMMLIVASWVALHKFEKHNKKDIAEYLNTINETANQSFSSWLDRKYTASTVWAREIIPVTKELLKLPHTRNELINSNAQAEIRRLLRPLYTGGNYEGFFIVGPGNINLASSLDNNIGEINILAEQQGALQRMWSGETVVASTLLLSDVPLPEQQGKLQEERIMIFLGTPVKDESGTVIAILIRQIDPALDFVPILETARTGTTGETYCVDKTGRMITNSRFHDQLSEIGLIQAGESEILNLTVTDPGVNLVKGGKSKLPKEKWPLTKMAASVTAGQSGIDMKGYNDYRGERVIGVWKWNEKLGFGIATEIDTVNAFKALNFAKLIILLLTFLSVLILMGLIILFYRGLLKLSESELRFRSLYENSVMGLYRTTPAGKILLANPTLVKMLGFDSFEELKKRDLEEMSYIDYAKRLEFKKLFDEKDELTGFESEWYRKDGSVISVSESAKAVKDRFGHVKYYDGTVEDITTRKQAENALKESERNLRTVIEANPSPILIVQDEHLILVNPSAVALTGYSAEELIGKNFIDLIHPDQRGMIADHAKKRLAGLPVLNRYNLQYVTKSGETRWLDFSPQLFRYNEKPAIIATGIDITGKIQLEGQIKESEHRLSTIFETSPVPLLLSNLSDGSIVLANESLKKTIGINSKELFSKKTSDFYYDQNDREKIMDLLRKDGHIKNFEIRFKNVDGSIFWCNLSVQVLLIDNQKMVLSGFNDITALKHVEEKIRQLNEELESRVTERTLELQLLNESLNREITERKQTEKEIQKLSQAVEQAPAVVVITDKNGNIEYTNPAFTNGSGYLPEEVKGKNPRILKSGYHPKSFYDKIWATISSGKVWRGDILNKKKNGELFWENTSISPIFSLEEEITHFVSVKTDITFRKKMEEELIQAKMEAEQANLAKSEFLSRMSHELRTPMNSILGFAQLMEMEELIPAHKRRITHIRKNGKHLLELINEVLDISKIEAGHITLSLEAIEICTVMKDIRDIVTPLLSESNITIEIKQEDNLFVKADFQRLKQVLLNLINNAIKYNRKNGLIKIDCERKEREEEQDPVVRISISDTGMGIAPGNISKLFTPFERIGAEKTETEGTGLGLAVVKRLTDAMGGDIGVESTLGEGSTFWLDLPIAESPAVNAHLSNSKVIKSSTSNKSGTILYIEDNDSNIDLVEQILKEHRASISLVTSKYGNNTIRLAKEYKPDLILLDLDLPDTHGNEVLKLLQADTMTKVIPVVILSADAMEKQVKNLLEAGAKSYLTKPLDVIQFLQVVDEYLYDYPLSHLLP